MSIGGRALGKMHGPFVTALVCPRLHWMMWFEPYTVHITKKTAEPVETNTVRVLGEVENSQLDLLLIPLDITLHTL